MRIAIDFDETLITFDQNGDPQPVPGAADALKNLHEKGCYIIIHSCRTGLARQNNKLQSELEAMTLCLRQFEIPFDEIWTGTKLIADLYVDDRAVRFEGDWPKILSEVRGRGLPPRK